jgi:hypothetical protein
MTKVSWETKKFIWVCWAKGDKDQDILTKLQLKKDLYKDGPTHRDTVSKVREELLEMDIGKIRMLLADEQNIKGFVLEKRPELKAQIENTGNTASKPIQDEVILSQISQVFDRPAFNTGFGGDRPITGFDKAISDTIEALNTGLWKTRDGTVISKIGSRHEIKDKGIRTKLGLIEKDLVELRAKFNQGLITGCFYIVETGQSQYLKVRDTDATLEIERLKNKVVGSFKEIYHESGLNL